MFSFPDSFLWKMLQKAKSVPLIKILALINIWQGGHAISQCQMRKLCYYTISLTFCHIYFPWIKIDLKSRFCKIFILNDTFVFSTPFPHFSHNATNLNIIIITRFFFIVHKIKPVCGIVRCTNAIQKNANTKFLRFR